MRWQDKKPNTEVLQLCDMSGIEAFLTAAQFRWTDHVICMNDDKLPKVIFYSEIKDATHSRGGQRKRYKDLLKSNMKRCDMVLNNLETLVLNSTAWQSCCSPV